MILGNIIGWVSAAVARRNDNSACLHFEIIKEIEEMCHVSVSWIEGQILLSVGSGYGYANV